MTCIKWSNLVLILAAYDVFDIVTKMVDALKDKKKTRAVLKMKLNIFPAFFKMTKCFRKIRPWYFGEGFFLDVSTMPLPTYSK